MSLVERALRKYRSRDEAALLGSGAVAASPAPAPPAPSIQATEPVPPLPPDKGEGIIALQPAGRCIAVPSHDASDPMRQVWDPQGNSALVSQLRNIRREVATLLDARVGTQHGRVVLVTSALPNEGKSFLSLGLARVLSSEKDRRAVLVDADAPKHRLTDWLGTSGQPGLVDCLAGERTVADVLCPTDDAGLSFLPAGRWRDEAPELISSPKVDSIFGAFRRCDGRHVFVVDTAPVLAVGETIYLAARADLVVLVVRADQTPRAAVDEAIRKLAADRPLAIVLNGQQSSALEDYYGYRDYYGAYLPEREG